jgi:hypothetical protein
MASDIAPAPSFAERPGTNYERTLNVSNPARQGPVRFQEGLVSDTDVPTEFSKGYQQGVITTPGRPNHNVNVYEKYPEETMKERAHVGSASWVEAPALLGEFSEGSFADYSAPEFQQMLRSGARQQRANPATVSD